MIRFALTFTVITVLLFAAMRQFPVDPLRAYRGQTHALTIQDQTVVRDHLGMTRSVPVQYLMWLLRMCTGDYGDSTMMARPVLNIVASTFARTFAVQLASLFLSSLSLIFLERLEHRFQRAVRVVLMSVPAVFFGLLLAYAAPRGAGWTFVFSVVLTSLLALALTIGRNDLPSYFKILRISPVLLASAPIIETSLRYGGLGYTAFRAISVKDASLTAASLFWLLSLILIISESADVLRRERSERICFPAAHRTGFWIGIGLLSTCVSLAVFVPMLTSRALQSFDLTKVGVPPSWQYLLGTDEQGREMFSLILTGARSTLVIAFAVAAVVCLCSAVLGYVTINRGKTVFAWISGLFRDVPYLPAVLLTATLFLGSLAQEMRIVALCLLIAVSELAVFQDRVACATRKVLHSGYYQAAEILNVPAGALFFDHYLPNILPSMAAVFLSSSVVTILTESSLSFLGLGVDPPLITLGSLLSVGRDICIFQSMPWVWVAPGVFLTLLLCGVILVRQGVSEP